MQTTGQSFGEAVRAARLARGSTMRDVASSAEVTERQLNRIESGESVPRLDLAQRLARVLGLSLDAMQAAR